MSYYGQGYPGNRPGQPQYNNNIPYQQQQQPPYGHSPYPNNGYPPQQPYPPQSYPNAGYPPPHPSRPHSNPGYPPQNYPPPPHAPYAGGHYPQDPPFSPSNPPLSQANYQQPPHSTHNQSPNPVPYGVPASSNDMNEFVMYVDPKARNMPPPNFQLSNCQGRKRALLIGINYFNTSAELKGCINDVHNMKDFLITLYGFRADDMVILTDDQNNPKSLPTKRNIIEAMKWLVRDARPNDSFFFHFSGHGGRMKDYDGDEDDGYDETIYPVDHATYGQIVDDMMHDIMVRPLPPGCRLTAIFDSCHSGTALDLPYIYSTQGAIKEHSLLKSAGNVLKDAGKAYISGNGPRAISSVMSLASGLLTGKMSSAQNAKVKQMKSSPADVIMFSGCKDAQTSADTTENGRSTGAMSYAITTSLRANKHQSYIQLLKSVRGILYQKYQQRPQLSASHPMDVNLMFII